MEEAARQVAAAVEEARKQVRREAAEEVAKQVAAAEERARREGAEDAARQVAAAVEEAREQVRREAAEESAGQVAADEKRARMVEAEEGALEIAAVAAAEERPPRPAIEEVASIAASAVELRPVQSRPKASEGVIQGASGAAEQVPGNADKDEPPEVVAAAEDQARLDSGEALPVHMWVKAAMQSDDAGAAADWPHELLRKPGKAEVDG
jgi:hypothetical protein